MKSLFHVSVSPHIQHKMTTSHIMRDVLIALLPATIFGIYMFGIDAVIVIVTCCGSSVAFEYLYNEMLHKKQTIADGSALVTGLLLALNLPSSIPIWMCMLASLFAIILVKQLFGGIGQNFMNPALAGRAFLVISFAKPMTTFVLDGVSSATPLMLLKRGKDIDLLKMFIGTIGGSIGETSVIAILMGAIYLLVRRVIKPIIPLISLSVFALCIVAFGGKGFDMTFLLAHLCGGGLMFGVWFMATDYVTSPITNKGKIIFAAAIGFLTAIIRIYGNGVEGMSFAILIANLFVPLIDKATKPVAFGKGRA